MKTPQIAPVSDLRMKHVQVFAKTELTIARGEETVETLTEAEIGRMDLNSMKMLTKRNTYAA